VNDRVDRETLARLRDYAGRGDEIARRLQRLEQEWDIERVLELNAAAIGLVGMALGVARDRRWLVVPGAVLAFLALHASDGWCPPVSLFRRLGVRTRREIERERYAMKGMRGDFEGAARRSQAAWRAVRSSDSTR
jgi:hypothetical protein